jgi:hypothetical protein
MRQTRVGMALAVVAAGSLVCGVTAMHQQPRARAISQREIAAPRSGSWNVDRRNPPFVDPESVQRLQSIGYLAGYRVAPSQNDVTEWNRDAAWKGMNLYTSGHEAEATLIAMDGRVVRRWHCPYRRAFPNQPLLPSTPAGREHWRRVRMTPDGGLLAIYEGQGLIRLDAQSHLLWALRIGAHHDLQIRPDGMIVVLTRAVRVREEIHDGEPILEDFVTEVTPDGRVANSFSLLDAFLHSDYAACLQKAPPDGDILHTNTLQVLDRTDPRAPDVFRAGNLLVSSPQIDTIAIVDPRNQRVVWALSGMWHFQHEPVLLVGGTLLLLDNRGLGGRRSRVLEIDPLTQRIVWSYEGDRAHPFFTEFNGSVQRLPNGDTLIVESDAGRAFEIDRDRRIVWEFYNPHRAGDHAQLVASLFDLIRLSEDVE